MKKILFILAFVASFAFPAKNTVVLELCRYNHCYTQVYHNVKRAESLEDSFGNTFVRLYLTDGRLLDVGGMAVTIKK